MSASFQPMLLERERELATLESAARRAKDGTGSALLIAGAAGVGKSALLAAGSAAGQAEGLSVHAARGSELEQELPFGVMRQLLEPRLRRLTTTARNAVFLGEASPAQRLFSDVPLDQRAAGDGFAILHALFCLFAGLAEERPLILAVDDVQWVDPPSLRALLYLAGRIAELPLLLAATLRRHEPTPVGELVLGLEDLPVTAMVELGALSPSAVQALVQEALPPAGAELCSAFADSSAGNPFYLRELLRSVIGAHGEAPSVHDVRRAAVATVGDRVMRRLTAPPGGGPVRLAQAMATLGASGRLDDAAAVARLDAPAAAEAALVMRRAEILGTEDPFTWVHPLVQRSILDGLTVVERDDLHARSAEVLARSGAALGVVAAHLAALRPAGSTSVVAGLLTAAEDALGRDAPELAVRLIKRALQEGAPEPSRAALLLRLGQVEVSRRNPAAAEVLREALQLAVDGRSQALAALGLAESLVFDGRWEEANRVTEEALSVIDGEDEELRLELELARALICAMDPQLAARLRRDRARLRALAVGSSWPARALSAALAMTGAFSGERPGEVVALCDHALADGVLLAERGAGAFASGHVGTALIAVEEIDRGVLLADELEVAARAQGSVANTIVATLLRGTALARRGELRSAAEMLGPVIEMAVEQGMLVVAVSGLWNLIDAIVERPALDGLAQLAQSLPMPPAFAEAAGGAWLGHCRGRLLAERGALAEARLELRRAVATFDALGFGPLHTSSRSELALVLPPGEQAQARALAAQELTLAREVGVPRAVGVALRAWGLLADRARRVEILHESVTTLARSPARYEHARSLVELGAALRRDGRRGDAREPLEAAWELASACGAERLSERAHEELIFAGRRPRRVARRGYDALTASERRVVRLAAAGQSNGEIAQALFLSLKTIETHLTNAYGKLGLSGAGARRRLPEMLANQPTAHGADR